MRCPRRLSALKEAAANPPTTKPLSDGVTLQPKAELAESALKAKIVTLQAEIERLSKPCAECEARRIKARDRVAKHRSKNA